MNPHSDQLTFELVTLGASALRSLGPHGRTETILPVGKPLAVLAYLDASPARRASREHLIDLLWADLPPSDGRHALRQVIWYVRQRVGEDVLVGTDGDIALAVSVHSDRSAFLNALDAGAVEHAVELYEGDFFPGYAAPGGVEFEHWLDTERRRLRLAFLRAGQAVVRKYLGVGGGQVAQRLAKRVRDAVPEIEAAQRLPLEASLSSADPLAIALDADMLESWLAGQKREPEPATSELLARARGGGYEHAPSMATSASGHGLSVQLIGREREFDAVVRASAGMRHGLGCHIHILGEAGYGKTRLLSDLGRRLRDSGIRTVAARANPGEQTVPYAFAADIALRLARLPGAAAVSPASATSLVALHPSLSAHYPCAADPSTGSEALRRRTGAITELLGTVADEQAVVLLLDDLHWADDLSRQVIHSVAERVPAFACLIVTSARPCSSAAQTGVAAEVLELAPLTEDQTASGLRGRQREVSWAGATGGSQDGCCETVSPVAETMKYRLEASNRSTASTDTSARARHRGRLILDRARSPARCRTP